MGSEELSVISTKNLPHEVEPGLVRICPTMDLIAVATRDGRVEVYRLSEQRAFGVQRKQKDLKIESMCWKYNGQYLAVSWSDGVVDVVSSESGNALQNFRQVTSFTETSHSSSSVDGGTVTCLGWGMNLLDIQAARARTTSKNGEPMDGEFSSRSHVTLDDFLEREPDLENLDMPIELPDQLATFDATELMPKLPTLSVLPASAYKAGQLSLAEMFASQPLLDAALHRGPSKDLNALNIFLLSGPNGIIRLVVYDSLSIGNISLPGADNAVSVHHVRHCSHPFAHCHVLLSEICQKNGRTCLALLPISLRFLKNAGRNIHFIDFKTAQLDTLVQYIGECILAIHHHWKHAHDLPSRFQRNISEELAEKEEPDLAQSLYQLAATGYCSPTLKEWLVDQLNERGHKRWDQAITQGYTKVIELIQENLLPALDRCSAILTNLQGLAQYYEHSPAFDVPISSFYAIQDIMRCMRLISHHMLFFGSEEQRRFASFSKWLRHQIDVQAADPNSTAGQDIVERDAGVDYVLVFSYIEKALVRSKLDVFLCHPTDAPEVKANPEMYESLRQALQAFKESGASQQDILKLSSYHSEWCRQNSDLIEQITTWQRANAFIPGALILEQVETSACEVRMITDDSKSSTPIWTYVLTRLADEPASFTAYRFLHSEVFDDIPKSTAKGEAVKLTLPEGEILDFKFVDDNEILVLVQLRRGALLLAISITKSSNFPGLDFEALAHSVKEIKWPNGHAAKCNANLDLSQEDVKKCVRYRFADESFCPARIEVNGRKDRRLCVAIGNDLHQMKIIDLDNLEGDSRESSTRLSSPNLDTMEE